MSLKKKTVSAFKWSFLSQGGRQGLQWVTTLILARLLLPSDYGLMGMSMVLIGFAHIFKGLGTSSAIIQSKNISEITCSTLFFLNIIFGILSALTLYLLAPSIAVFYHEPKVVELVEVLSLSFLISSFTVVHEAKLEKDIVFNKIAAAEFLAALIASVVGILLAFWGYGVWSLVVKSLTEVGLTSLLILFLSDWQPKMIFQIQEVKSIMKYSLNLTGFNVLNYLSRNADYILIGRYLGPTELGYYTLAYRIMFMPIQNITNVVNRITFPVYSKLQDDNHKFRKFYLKVKGYIAFITFPMMAGLTVVSQSFVISLFGNKWEPVALLLMILAPVGFMQSILGLSGNIFRAKGRTDIMLRLGALTSLVYVTSFILGLRWGIYGVAGAYAIAVVVMALPNLVISLNLISMPLVDYFSNLTNTIFCGGLMLITVLLVKFVSYEHLSSPMLLSTLVATGFVVYSGFTWKFNKGIIASLREVYLLKRK